MPKLYDVGGVYPADDHLERLAKYETCRVAFEGRLQELRERFMQVIAEDPDRLEQYKQLQRLLIAVNLPDIILTKPADLMVGEPPIYESGKGDRSPVQKALNSIVEENGLNKLIHEMVIGAGIRGDAFLKVRYDYRQDFSEIPEGYPKPKGTKPEPIIESVDPAYVFPEVSANSRKQFKAINIAYVYFIDTGKEEKPFLRVERHVPGYVIREDFELAEKPRVVTVDGVDLLQYDIIDQVSDPEIKATGADVPLVFHVPYKTTDESWEGIGGIEKILSLLEAIMDRLVQIDYILFKHSDPTMYGPALDESGTSTAAGGRYLEVNDQDVTPGYMTWESQLQGAFQELDKLVSMVFQISETPQWIFGTVVADNGSDGGTGTSHTDGMAIKARFMPILSKVKRIRVHVDEAVRDSLYYAMVMDKEKGGADYNAEYPKIHWKDGLPDSDKELAEIMNLRTGGKPTIDVKTAIKRMDELDDAQADAILKSIEEDTEKAAGFVDASIFNKDSGTEKQTEEKPEGDDEQDGGS
ncbi:phage portal protein [Paludifilum halophilum]|uniref:Phage portal protein n=1 Tax=Paludifilum halophilum TaxID=1642702 RepID=A0A235B8C9_9BACL|nr:phage portal protein [Paludifilum halophilum]OYD08536.1 hypothetical protein CHM34_06835 [Paludifilum halophilum]